MINKLFNLHADIHYLAIYRDGKLETKSIEGTEGASAAESDKYEELIVNPTVLKVTSQRGNIDCGGLDYVIIRYGNFFQLVIPTNWGQASVCVDKNAN